MRKMKDSGIEWIGEIPEGWDVVKTSYLCELFTGNSIKDQDKKNYEDSTNAVPYIATKDINLKFNTINYRNGMYVKNNDEHFKRTLIGDSLMCIEGGSAGKKKAKVEQECCFVNKLCCYHPVSVVPEFLFHVINSPHYEAEFFENLSGLIGGVGRKKLEQFRLPVAELNEQKRIANFLDQKCSKIDEAIAKQEKLIEKLKEYKQSLITETVTKGLDPNAKMKPSGIDWIGDIPEDWHVVKIKRLGSYKNGLTYSPANIVDSNNGTLVLRSSNIQEGKLCFKDNVFVDCNDDSSLVKKGDILICSRNGSKELIGKNAIIDNNVKAYFGAFMMIFRCQKPKFCKYLLDSNVFKYNLSSFFTSTINQLTAKNFGNIYVPYPCSTNDIKEIVLFLDKKCSAIDASVKKHQQSIDKLQEYKKSLIYEYVTGKKEVS